MTWAPNSPVAGSTRCLIVHLLEARTTACSDETITPQDGGRVLRGRDNWGLDHRNLQLQSRLHSDPTQQKSQRLLDYFCGRVPPLISKLQSYSRRTICVRDRLKL